MSLTAVNPTKDRIIEYLSRHAEAVEQQSLREQLQLSLDQFKNALRELMEDNRVTMSRTSSGIVIGLSSRGLSENFALVLEEVRRSGRSGVDQASLTAALRLSKSEVTKALNSLVAQKYVKECRSFTNRAKKMYLLFGLEPSAQVTGGCFYWGEELDVNFLDSLRCLLVSFLYQRKRATLQEIERFIDSLSMREEGTSTSPQSSPASIREELQHYSASPVSVIASDTSSPLFSSPLQSGHSGAPGGDPHAQAAQAQRQRQVVYAAANSLASKRLAPKDIKIVTQSLVLDGVVDELLDGAEEDEFGSFPLSEESGVRPGRVYYQLARGKNAMRHFSVLSLPVEAVGRKRGRSEGLVGRHVGGEGEERTTMVPSPLSLPSGPAAEWSYMPALGFPCLGCPQLTVCRAGGVVNSSECSYLSDFLF